MLRNQSYGFSWLVRLSKVDWFRLRSIECQSCHLSFHFIAKISLKVLKIIENNNNHAKMFRKQAANFNQIVGLFSLSRLTIISFKSKNIQFIKLNCRHLKRLNHWLPTIITKTLPIFLRLTISFVLS